MFKKFNVKNEIASKNNLKSSAQRNIKTKIADAYPAFADSEIGDFIIPKKATLYQLKCHEKVNIYYLPENTQAVKQIENESELEISCGILLKNIPLFFSQFDDELFPSLRVIHEYPRLLPCVTVDKGAIKHIISGSNVMAPGLVSEGGNIPDGLENGCVVSIMAENKKSALAIGKMLMSSEEIKNTKKGEAIQNIHYLGDYLWSLTQID